MKLSKTQKDVILSKLDVSIETVDGVEHLYWNAGEASYNIGMKQTWTKEQKQEIDGINSRLDRLESKVDNIEGNIKLVIDILARNGMK